MAMGAGVEAEWLAIRVLLGAGVEESGLLAAGWADALGGIEGVGCAQLGAEVRPALLLLEDEPFELAFERAQVALGHPLKNDFDLGIDHRADLVSCRHIVPSLCVPEMECMDSIIPWISRIVKDIFQKWHDRFPRHGVQ